MSLVQRFRVTERLTAPLGLQPVDMPRLGGLVALAGRNGAGKSRLLALLEQLVQQRSSDLPVVPRLRAQIKQFQALIAQNGSHEDVQRWRLQLVAEEARLETATEFVQGDELSPFTALRFVPKNLHLQDARAMGKQQVVSSADRAKQRGATDYEATSLPYIQRVQDRWWNATHQGFQGTDAEKKEAIDSYERLVVHFGRLLGPTLTRNLDGDATLYGKPIGDAGLSDGQKVLVQLCVALHARRGDLNSTVFILDEPENHLHPSASIDFISMLREAAPRAQIWIATHSVPLLAYVSSIDPMAIWYVNEGEVRNAGRKPELVLETLLGDEERLGQLQAFTGLPASLAVLNYACQSLLPPQVIADGSGDAQVSQVNRIVNGLAPNSALRLLDFGAGKGRMLSGAVQLHTRSELGLSSLWDYYAYDSMASNKEQCEAVIKDVYGSADGRYFNSREQFFQAKEDGSIEVVVLSNVLHEVSPSDWIALFAPNSLITRCLAPHGYVLIVEDQRIPVGENAHEFGFVLLDTSHLRTLFGVRDEDVKAGRFVVDDARGDGRLKAHLISRDLLGRLTSDTRRSAVSQLRETAKAEIAIIRNGPTSYSNGQLHAFWMHQFANTSLFLDSV